MTENSTIFIFIITNVINHTWVQQAVYYIITMDLYMQNIADRIS